MEELQHILGLAGVRRVYGWVEQGWNDDAMDSVRGTGANNGPKLLQNRRKG